MAGRGNNTGKVPSVGLGMVKLKKDPGERSAETWPEMTLKK